MVINPHYIPWSDINGIHHPSCFTGEETDQWTVRAAAHVMLPASLPHCDWRIRQMSFSFSITINALCSKTFSLLTIAYQPATIQLGPSLQLCCPLSPPHFLSSATPPPTFSNPRLPISQPPALVSLSGLSSNTRFYSLSPHHHLTCFVTSLIASNTLLTTCFDYLLPSWCHSLPSLNSLPFPSAIIKVHMST